MLSSPNKQTEKASGEAEEGGGTGKKKHPTNNKNLQNAVPSCLPHEGCK